MLERCQELRFDRAQCAGLTSSRDAAVKLMAEGAAQILAMVMDEVGRGREAYFLAEREAFQTLKRHLAWMVVAAGVSLLCEVVMVLLL